METVEVVRDGSPLASVRLSNRQPKSESNRDVATPVLPQILGKAGAEAGNRQKLILFFPALTPPN